MQSCGPPGIEFETNALAYRSVIPGFYSQSYVLQINMHLVGDKVFFLSVLYCIRRCVKSN